MIGNINFLKTCRLVFPILLDSEQEVWKSEPGTSKGKVHVIMVLPFQSTIPRISRIAFRFSWTWKFFRPMRLMWRSLQNITNRPVENVYVYSHKYTLPTEGAVFGLSRARTTPHWESRSVANAQSTFRLPIHPLMATQLEEYDFTEEQPPKKRLNDRKYIVQAMRQSGQKVSRK